MRKIKILSPGPIRAMGGIHGPILTPYTVDETKLASLLSEGLKIVEVMPNGREQEINIGSVYHSTNKAPEVVAPTVEEVVEEPKGEPVNVETFDAPTTEEVVDEVEETASEDSETTPEERRNDNNYHKNKHNKNRR